MRFFIEKQDENAKVIYVDGENGVHISKSLRMRQGESLILCDSKGTDYICEIEDFDGSVVIAKIMDKKSTTSEPKTKVSIYQCLPKLDKLEMVVQKSVELGAFETIPVKSDRCIAKIDAKNEDKKIARLQKIALEAAKQSGRGIIPQVHAVKRFKEAIIEASKAGDVIFLYENGGEPMSEVIKKSGDKIAVFIGPEGGFSDEEASLASELSVCTATLGERILRTETAPITALSIIMYEKGEM